MDDDLLSFLNIPQQQPIDDLDVWLKATVPVKENVGEESKKKRNTEASARFRQKKKEKDELLRAERDALNARVIQLQAKVAEQEKEIQWLRDLALKTSTDKQLIQSIVKQTIAEMK